MVRVSRPAPIDEAADRISAYVYGNILLLAALVVMTREDVRDGDLLDFDIQEVGVSQTILRQSRRTFLVADHSKLSRSAPARIGSLSQLDAIFTDRALPGDLARACEAWQTRVMLP